MSGRALGCLLVALAAAACRSPQQRASPPEPGSAPRLTSADLAAAQRDDAPFALEFEYDSLPHGAIRKLRIATDGRCRGVYHGMAQHEMEDGRRAGALSSADRKAILAALRDAPFDALDRVPASQVIDGEPVLLKLAIGGRRLLVDRQMTDLRAAGVEPLCRMLVGVLARLPRE